MRNLSSHRRNGQIVIALIRNLSAGGEHRHLRVADVKHAHTSKHSPRPCDQRQIQSLIGCLAAGHLRGDQMTVGVHGHAHQFQLSQIGAMIFAVAALHHPILVHLMIATCRRRVAMRTVKLADARLQNLIYRDAVLPDRCFKSLPALKLRQSREQAAEPVVIELHSPNLLPTQTRQQRGVTFNPFLDLVFGVIALGQDKDDPDREHPPAAQAHVRSVISDLPIVDLRNAQLDYQAEQQRNITYSCVGKLECLIHAPNDTLRISQSPGFISGKWQLKNLSIH